MAWRKIDGSMCDALLCQAAREGSHQGQPPGEFQGRLCTRDVFRQPARALPFRPYRYDDVRCHRVHATDDPLVSQPIVARSRTPGEADRAARPPRPGLEAKTMVNAPSLKSRSNSCASLPSSRLEKMAIVPPAREGQSRAAAQVFKPKQLSKFNYQ
jgi:hypothetical protein